MKTGIELITQERQEQIEKHGRTIEEDVRLNDDRQLVWGAVQLFSKEFGYATDNDDRPDGWDEDIWQKMQDKGYKERLIIAGALIAAEIDRISFQD